MKISAFITPATLFAFCIGSAIAAENARLSPEEFAILPWGWTPGDDQMLQDIYECCFNLAGFVAPEHLDKVAAAGLKGIVSDGSIHVSGDNAELKEEDIKIRVNDLPAKIAAPDAVFGYYLRDEPGADAFRALKLWNAAVKEAAPQASPYINLFPNYALKKSSYEEYVDDYASIVEPDFISYDHYALMDDGSLREGYFQNLEVVRNAALEHNLPFWNIVLSNAHFRYAEPSPAGLRFQLYTTLAYGARGISYFTYFAPKIGNYRLAPIDQFDHKTSTWDMLRDVNLQLHKLGPTYITLRSVNVFHHPSVPEGCSGIDTSLYLKDIEGDDLLVGEFEGPEQQFFILVVNKSLHHSTAFKPVFKEKGDVAFINGYTGTSAGWAGENNWLAPGQGMLMCLKKN